MEFRSGSCGAPRVFGAVASSGLKEGDYERVFALMEQVIGWYTTRILAEARARTPNADVLVRLRIERQACVADRQALETAPPEQVVVVAAAYDARFVELAGP
ncbi:hypothetical protein [Embleya sp. NPDC059237]|uniref:hypothetical protein n=1 Tax=Embleya sp. NPDC059237 TaxID=3346784 RepID=UPI00367D41C0